MIVNITDFRSDAIIVTTSAVKFIRLPELTAIEAIEWIQEDLTVYKKQDTHGRN